MAPFFPEKRHQSYICFLLLYFFRILREKVYSILTRPNIFHHLLTPPLSVDPTFQVKKVATVEMEIKYYLYVTWKQYR